MLLELKLEGRVSVLRDAEGEDKLTRHGSVLLCGERRVPLPGFLSDREFLFSFGRIIPSFKENPSCLSMLGFLPE